MWLTARELSNELHIPIPYVTVLRRRRKLAYINLGSLKEPRYRYKMPAATPAEIEPPIERIALLTYDEVAAILGLRRDAIRKIVERGDLKPASTAGNRQLVTIAEFRRCLAIRDKRRGQTKQAYSPILMKWLKGYIETREIQFQVLDILVKEAAAVPSDKRSGFITRLWDLFDRVNAVLREIEQERSRDWSG